MENGLDFRGETIYADLALAGDARLRALVGEVTARQRAAARKRLKAFVPDPDAEAAVSPERLEELRAAERPVYGIAQDRSISNAIIFNTPKYPDALKGRATMAARAKVDAWLAARLPEMFPDTPGLRLRNAGFFLYPPGGYMGWHTNAKVPGWRLMLSSADEPGRSFFRWRDPTDGQVHTSTDGAFNLRLNLLSAEAPVWHAVYSDTYRFSLVYAVVAP